MAITPPPCYAALYANRSASGNTALGFDALYANVQGKENTAAGQAALKSNTFGNNNIADGYQAGYNVTGSNNIDIGNEGLATDSGVIRIGTSAPALQTNTFIAGIYGNTSVTGLAVVVDSTGQLGVTGTSSERFKTAIAAMGSNSAKLAQLQPVTFRLKADPKGIVHYGLIAEEVAKVYPELVIRDAQGRIDGVRYDELAPLLLNEVQRQQTMLADQDEQNAAEVAQIRELRRQLDEIKDLRQELHAAQQTLQSPGIVAQR